MPQQSDPELRVVWRDKSFEAHAVVLTGVNAERAKARFDAGEAFVPFQGWINTLCGLELPFVSRLVIDEGVSCEECIELDGTDAVLWAALFLNSRREVPA